MSNVDDADVLKSLLTIDVAEARARVAEIRAELEALAARDRERGDVFDEAFELDRELEHELHAQLAVLSTLEGAAC